MRKIFVCLVPGQALLMRQRQFLVSMTITRRSRCTQIAVPGSVRPDKPRTPTPVAQIHKCTPTSIAQEPVDRKQEMCINELLKSRKWLTVSVLQ